jgi:alpha-tubulin suppressor-like RCC1 family protein
MILGSPEPYPTDPAAAQFPAELPPLRKALRLRSFASNVALTLDGRVFVWRVAGLMTSNNGSKLNEEPTSMLPPDEVAVDIAAGEGHVVVLTECGRVWTFGWRPFSALGRPMGPNAESSLVAAPVPGIERAVQVDAGASFTMVLDALGQLWLFGEGPCIIGCFGDPHALYEPRRVPAKTFGGRRVLAASCGEGHVLVLTAYDPSCRLPQPGAWFSSRNHSSSSSGERPLRA